MNGILTWADLHKFEVEDLDRVHGINNSYANLRLFGHTENGGKFASNISASHN